SCCGADSDLERALRIRLRMFGQFALNLDCTANGARCRYERGHDAVASVLDFAATQIGQRVSHDSVVQVEQFHGRLITQRLSQCSRFHDVREENGPDPRVARIGFAARQDGCSRRIRLDIAEKSICELGLYLDNLSSDETVRFTV